MSIKTLRKRIALVAVSALGVGILSVPSANAVAAGAISYIDSGSIAVCAIYDADTEEFTALGGGDVTGELANPLTITVAVGGKVKLQTGDQYFTYNSGGIVTIANNATAAVLHSSYGLFDAEDTDGFDFTANTVGTVTVNSYASDPFTAANTAADVDLASTLTINIVATCSASSFSTTYSAWQVSGEVLTAPSLTAGDTLTYGAGSEAYISLKLKNGYNANLPGTATVVASATNGAKVKLDTATTLDDDTTAAGTLSSASKVMGGNANMYVRVTPANLASGGSTEVTVSVDGVTALTRTITFLAEAAKMVVVSSLVGVNGGEGSLLYALQDSAGNAVPGAVSVRSLTLTPRISAVSRIKSATIVASDISAAGTETINAVDAATVWGGSASATSKYGVMKWTCQSGAGTGEGKVTLRHTTPVNAAYVDTEVTLKCAGGLDTYTASMDKASYNIGEIATLTISAKDSTGAAVNDFTYLNSSTAPDVTAGGATITKATSTSDTFLGGVKTYKFQVTTAGTFNAVVNLPGTTTKSVTAGYKVVNPSAGVTNEEVLAAIVKLIASINKQIKALQKSLRR